MNEREIRKLRHKFISVAMLAFLLVTTFIGMLINFLNYYVAMREVNWSLEQILAEEGNIENIKKRDDMDDDDMLSIYELFAPSYHSNNFYILKYDENGNCISSMSSRGDVEPDDDLLETAREIFESGDTRGRQGMYYYRIEKDDDGNNVLALIDSSAMLYTRMRLSYTTFAVGGLALIITFVLVVIMSRKMIEPEIEMSKRQTQFLTNVSHELKTPLTVIRMNAEMEQEINGDNEWMDSTIRQVDRMDALIKNLVMITKQREVEGSTTSTEVDVSTVVSDTASEFISLAEKEGLTFEKKIPDGVTLVSDESKIRQLSMILFDNAIKYCDKDGTIIAHIETLTIKKGMRLTVSNSYMEGKNIDCSKFFDRFYREDESHNIDSGGFGIGLSIAESICEEHKGKIRAQWKDGMISFICDLYNLK